LYKTHLRKWEVSSMRAMHVGEDPVVFDEATSTLEDGVVRERVRVIEV
jgi:hypothetical protein